MRYTTSLEGILPEHLDGGFFDGWPNKPTPEVHLKILRGSWKVVLAVDEDSGKVAGFINAVSRILSAYIPLLEVLPQYRNRGIGTQLVQLMLDELNMLYMVDLLCDESLRPFYEKLGMKPATGMMIRNYKRQSGI
ncbi:GNAT family N-acetyltransferase [Staphylospora marina]|uniref:GNAT family N-acetyltransferase n=1 Tax=Staphylospora marina TaxID=2490858 RepID=UPI000F5BFF74|nr:GNAT family N-acetyltransferase [Staphylospora marina]